MRPEELPEDIDGHPAENPYQKGMAFLWQEREYWRHWKRVKRDTGSWPLLSVLFHVCITAALMANCWLFLALRDSRDWSTSKQWLIGCGFLFLWIITLHAGRELIRRYEAGLYTEHEEERHHFVNRR
jgi:hypothetical protein